MNKILAHIIVFASLVCIASPVLADNGGVIRIPNPLGDETKSFYCLLMKIAQGVGMFITYLGVIMIIVSGILFLISAGNPEKMATAKKALIYAIVGIAVGLASSTIVEIIKDILGASNNTGFSC